MSNGELFKYDVRVRERFVTGGEITKSDVERYLTALVDVADQCEDVDLEQPALAKEADSSKEPPVEAPVSFTTGEGLSPAFAAAPAERAPSPAIAEPVPGASGEPAVNQPAEAAPAVSQESPQPSAPVSSEQHGPASVPPPTASVDADWGDS